MVPHLKSFLIVLSLCIGTAFSMRVTSMLHHSVVLDPDGNFHLSWDFDKDIIVFEVRVKTLGYVGLGLSPNGGMAGADVIIGGVNDVDGTVYFEDRHAVGMKEPLLDKSQDWQPESGSQNDTHTILRFWRKLDTCDDNDRRITTDTARVIWAYHDNDWGSDVTGSVRYHGSRRGSKSVLLLNPQKVLPKMPNDVVTVDFINDKVKVPAEDTVYWCQAYSMHMYREKHHVIKVEPIIQPGNEQLVHHIVLYACPIGTANETAGQGGPCWANFMPPAWRGCVSTIFAWAVGAGPLYLPEHVGYPWGYEDDPKLILLQTHFDNPGKRNDWVDSSGLRLTLTQQLRQYDAGSVSVGVTVWKTHIIPPHAEHFTTAGHCVPDCITQSMGNVSEINLFASFPHAHLIGTGVRFRHFRGGKELRPITVDDNYDFNYQETRLLEEEVKVLPGDHLVTECTYNTMKKTNVTFGGESTNEEMCLTFAMYYPRTGLVNCHSLVNPESLINFANLTIFPNYTVNLPLSKRGRGVFDVLANDLDWKDKAMTDRAQELANNNTVVAMCFSDKVFPVHTKTVKLPAVTEPYLEPRVCLSGAVTSSVLAGFVYLMTAMVLLFH
ncbi:DBH-like monooxygenase protein 1 [Liolophura sinensis]|uniref:DBH-like monooxygenase protein 1 n=1 Tax=Liolophura sinensis TaxID=3198878 RepID=UPI0031590893